MTDELVGVRPGWSHWRPAGLHVVVGVLLTLAAVLALTILSLPRQALLIVHVPPSLAVAGLLGATVVSELFRIRVPHGDTSEDLAFFEAVVVVAALMLPPTIVLAVALVGPTAVWIIRRRTAIQTLFNVGMFGVALSTMLLLVHLVGGNGHETLDKAVLLALFVGTAAFGAINLLAMAFVMAVAENAPFLGWVRSEAVATLTMVGGNLGMALLAMNVAMSNPLLLPFVGLPLLALVNSYRQSRHHAEERRRANALLILSSALTATGGTAEVAAALVPPLRSLFDADRVAIELGEEGPVPARSQVVPLDLGDGPRGRLVLGWDEQSAAGGGLRREVDEPLLATTAVAVASAMRSALHLRALVEESSKLQAVIDETTDGIAVIDADGEIQVWSPSMRRLFGESPRLAARALHPDPVVSLLATLGRDPAAVASTLPALLPPDRLRAVVELSLVAAQGDDRDLQVSVSRIHEHGTSLAVLMVRDATEQRRVERMKEDFVATVSHELRTPITPIKGYARLLATRGDQMEPARRLHALQLIEDRADHLGRLVDDLLMASRVRPTETSKLAVTIDTVDLRNIVNLVAESHPLLSHRIEVRIPAHAVPVSCDEVRAVQCLSNLISNAEKYSAEDTPIVVELAEDKGAGTAWVDVVDRGRGIPTEELDRIFERFHRVESAFTMSTGGSGLGLFIGRELARAMRGDVSVTSILGVGSTFRFILPMVTSESPAADPVGAGAVSVSSRGSS